MSAPEKPFYFPLLSGSSPEKASSISSMPCQSLSNLRFIHRSRNQLFPQSYDSCLQSRSVPSPSPRLLSRLHFVFVSISTAMSSLQYRRCTLIRLLPLFFSVVSTFVLVSISTSTSSYNIDDTPFNSAPFPYPHLRSFPTFPSAISTFY